MALVTSIDLFPRFSDALPEYGFGDAQLWLTLRRMSATQQPVLNTSGLNGNSPGSALAMDTMNTFSDARFEITELGESVLGGEADFVSLNGSDIWLGGVHLDSQKALWRWDEQSKRIVSK